MNEFIKIDTCQICMEEKNEVKVLKHIYAVGDISSHKMCSDCYKCLKNNVCPFCNGKILKETKEMKGHNYNIWTSINWGIAGMCLPQPGFPT
jgi:hypothetical protein